MIIVIYWDMFGNATRAGDKNKLSQNLIARLSRVSSTMITIRRFKSSVSSESGHQAVSKQRMVQI
jgi:hypothetical protein